MTVRVVLDTNVVLSALLFDAGRLVWIRNDWMAGRIRPVVCRETIAELVRALAYPKFRLDRSGREELLGDFLPHVETVAKVDPAVELPQCSDPADQVFLRLATSAGASLLVTGDRALLELEGEVPFRIITPAELKERVGRGR